jgi:hypothetical protein
MSSGYHTSWKVPPEHREDPEYRAAGWRVDFARAVYDRRSTRPGLNRRAGRGTRHATPGAADCCGFASASSSPPPHTVSERASTATGAATRSAVFLYS